MPKLDQKSFEESAWLSILGDQVRSLRYGVVQVVVHDSRVIRIERTEKLRLDREDLRSSPVTGQDGDLSPGGVR